MIVPALVLMVAAAAEAGPLKLAVVVGSEAGVGNRPALKFAHDDALAFASALEDAAGFPKDQVAVLLDPAPAAVLAALDAARATARAAKTEALLVFYYSGHTDAHSLYPGGNALPLDALKERLADEAVGVRIGVIDGCHGGGWTQTKGLKPAQPFEVTGPSGLGTEGLALLAASSGAEDAHEAEVLKGSFFTHHLIAGLRGAADKSGDGKVTLGEAIAYASRLTIRDTAARAPEPQHPSFDLRLHGRQDVVLSAPGGNKTLLTLEQSEGPLELVELSTGVVVLEATPGKRHLVLAVTPGDYLVRQLRSDGVRSKAVAIHLGEATHVDEASLTLVGGRLDVAKGVDPGLHRLQVGIQNGLSVTDPWAIGLGAELRVELRFLTRFAVRARGAYQYNAATALTKQLLRDYAVLPTSIRCLQFTAGADAVLYPWWSEHFGDGLGVAFSVSLGGGVAAFNGPTNQMATSVAPHASAGGGVSLSLGRTRLSVELNFTEHVAILSSGLAPYSLIGLGLSWGIG